MFERLQSKWLSLVNVTESEECSVPWVNSAEVTALDSLSVGDHSGWSSSADSVLENDYLHTGHLNLAWVTPVRREHESKLSLCEF